MLWSDSELRGIISFSFVFYSSFFFFEALIQSSVDADAVFFGCFLGHLIRK